MDPAYKNANFILQSAGVSARAVDDQTPQKTYLNMLAVEELAEGALGTRLGSVLVNTDGASVFPLSGPVHSANKLNGLDGQAWRYAGSGGNLYRRSAAGRGEYSMIANNLSGQPWTVQADSPNDLWTGVPYLFVADGFRMLKDNGTLAAPQQMGIFQPQVPVQAESQPPDEVVLDTFENFSGYVTSNITSFTFPVAVVQINLLAAITAPGIQEVPVSNPQAVGLFQSLVIDAGVQAETVLVLGVTSTGIVANFKKTHVSGELAQEFGWVANVAASVTGFVARSFGAFPIEAWPTTLNQEDYIAARLFVSDPTQIQSITLKFDCGDGSFQNDYFYKVIAQGPLQAVIAAATSPSSTTATTAATNALLDQSLGLFGPSQGSIAQLNTGLNSTTGLLIQLSDFAGSGRADFNDPVFNWQAVNGYQLTVLMNDQSSATVKLSSLLLFGGAGPDTFAGVAYDYLFTFYNNVDGTESNPCMVMSNVNPPNDTNFVYPRRQPVKLTFTFPTLDSQTTSLRAYRRGGTLGDNYRRLDTIPITGSPQTYLDTYADADIQANDFVSFVNDVPVTSTLQVPVNTVLVQPIHAVDQNSIVSVYPQSMANISVSQQVSLGNAGALANTFETVIVLSVASDHFIAFVQNVHLAGEPVSATAKYGQPVTIIAEAFGQFWYAGDTNNPNYLYYAPKGYPQSVGSANYVPVSTADDTITAVVGYKGNLYVSTVKGGWFAVAPGQSAGQSPTVYPTACKHGCVAPLGWIATEEGIPYQAIDGIRFFSGGASEYLTQEQEFIFQGVGSSPIVEADPTQFSQTRAAYWNMMIFFSYVGVDGNRHRLIFHQQYKRWRNDDFDAQSMFLETDTNQLIVGDSQGLVHIDRQDQFYDEGNQSGTLVQLPITMNLQTSYSDFGMPEATKSFQELTLDINTQGQTLAVYLWFEDGEVWELIGSVNTVERSKVNFSLNNGNGYEFYKASVQIVGNVTQAAYTYQIGLKALGLAKTRLVMDTFWLRLSQDSNSIAKDSFWEYTSSAVINVNVYYDGAAQPFYSFTLPNSNGVRSQQRVRLPAVAFKMIRLIATSESDFQIWGDESCIESKPQVTGKGYAKMPFVPNA